MDAKLAAIIANQTRQSASEQLHYTVKGLEDAVREITRYQERFGQATNDRERAQVINWTINHLVSNIMPNLRIDLLANCQAELVALADTGSGDD